jgi:hypothetical protein
MADPDDKVNRFFLARLNGEKALRILLSQEIPEPEVKLSAGLEARVTEDLNTRRRRPDELIPRKTGDIYLNFYDLGQLADGSDIPFILVPDLQQSTSSFDSVVQDLWGFSNWADLSAVVYAEDMEDWATAYKKLGYEEAETYGLDIYLGSNLSVETAKYHPVARPGSRNWMRDQSTPVSNTNWTEDGLKVPKGANNLAIASGLAFVNTHTGFGWNSVKWTLTNDPFDTWVDLNLTQDADVFLFPMPVFEVAFTSPDIAATRYILNALFTTMPREFYLGRDIVFDGTGDTGTGTAFEIPSFIGDEVDIPTHDDLIDFLRTRAATRHYNYHNDTTHDPALYPIPAVTSYVGHTSFTSFADWPSVGTLIYSGSPVAVIRKGDTWYWGWNITGTRPATQSMFSN